MRISDWSSDVCSSDLLVECVAEAGGHAAFWQAVEWVYAHTRSDGQGLPDGLRYPESTPAVEQCMTSERADAVIRAPATEATKGGVTATPSLRLLDRQTRSDERRVGEESVRTGRSRW